MSRSPEIASPRRNVEFERFDASERRRGVIWSITYVFTAAGLVPSARPKSMIASTRCLWSSSSFDARSMSISGPMSRAPSTFPDSIASFA